MNKGKLVFDGGARAGVTILGKRIVVLGGSVIAFNLIGFGTLTLWPASAYVYAVLAMILVMWLALRTTTRMRSERPPTPVRRPVKSAPHLPTASTLATRGLAPGFAPSPRPRQTPPSGRAMWPQSPPTPMPRRRPFPSDLDSAARQLAARLRLQGASPEQVTDAVTAFVESAGRDVPVEELHSRMPTVVDIRAQEAVVEAMVVGLGSTATYAALRVADDPDRAI